MPINSGMLSSKTDLWSTPKDFYYKLNIEFKFNLDPCCTHANAKCLHHYTIIEDGLALPWCWPDRETKVFMNPPYGRKITAWMKKAYMESQDSYAPKVIVCLVPSRTDTKWWHNYCMKASEIRFVKGRLKFGSAINTAPFPSAIIIFDNNKKFKNFPVISTI